MKGDWVYHEMMLRAVASWIKPLQDEWERSKADVNLAYATPTQDQNFSRMTFLDERYIKYSAALIAVTSQLAVAAAEAQAIVASKTNQGTADTADTELSIPII